MRGNRNTRREGDGSEDEPTFQFSADAREAFAEYIQRPPWRQRPEVLIGPMTPIPMHGLVPRTVLGKEWWDKTRRAAYASTDYHCVACGVHRSKARGRRWLEAHELFSVEYEAGRWTYLETVPLCNFCHSYVHAGRLGEMVRQRYVTQARYKAIIVHGDRLLRKHGLVRTIYNGPEAPWQQWRMEVNGALYPSLFRNYAHWVETRNTARA